MPAGEVVCHARGSKSQSSVVAQRPQCSDRAVAAPVACLATGWPRLTEADRY
jgi:hypothetical protein